MDDLEQIAALRAFVDDLVERMVTGTAGDAAEDGPGHGLKLPHTISLCPTHER
jgi:hypothetical protein